MPTEEAIPKKGLRSALIIAGPTASGKSAMAMDVAEHFSGTVINADSMQVYRELRIITARPSIEDEQRVPHRLFGVLSGREMCSAGRWCAMAVAEIEACFAAGRLPVLVGGTGMYLKSLVEGLSPIPDIEPRFREQATALHAELGAQMFWGEVEKLDPVSAARLPVGDTQRLLRVWEVTTATGRPLSEWQDLPRIAPLPDVNFAHIAVVPPRDVLYGGIDARFSRMVEEGTLDEVRALMDLDLDPALPLMKALGVPELMAFLKGEMSKEQAISQAQKVSRNYAKRQLTWVRSQLPDAYILPAQYSKSFQQKIFSFVHDFLLTGRA
ncbi:tRNA (adenosine(37)-N6)-dimethylallyltransferase MiaA [Magnetovibrio sp.]|uniref:tRNA (adenosine(37)-N6)-dimethylallyltransferase MiaA n=1 Tax=Magnetovibrio sp. TaxID=2024836 RepID=UPI002F93F7E6